MDLGKSAAGKQSKPSYFDAAARGATAKHRFITPEPGMSLLFFRHTSFMVMAAGPPLTAILLALGALAWMDFRLNMFLNVMTPLIMVISFSDSMQLTFAARDRLLAGQTKYGALRDALLIVGPACVLTHATAGFSFVALQFSNSDLIVVFGRAGLIAIIIALGAVLLLTPLLGLLLLRDDPRFVAKISRRDFGVATLRRFLCLHRPPCGQSPRLVQCFWTAARRRARFQLFQDRTEIPTRRPGSAK